MSIHAWSHGFFELNIVHRELTGFFFAKSHEVHRAGSMESLEPVNSFVYVGKGGQKDSLKSKGRKEHFACTPSHNHMEPEVTLGLRYMVSCLLKFVQNFDRYNIFTKTVYFKKLV
jgi:hypothetical protein